MLFKHTCVCLKNPLYTKPLSVTKLEHIFLLIVHLCSIVLFHCETGPKGCKNLLNYLEFIDILP